MFVYRISAKRISSSTSLDHLYAHWMSLCAPAFQYAIIIRISNLQRAPMKERAHHPHRVAQCLGVTAGAFIVDLQLPNCPNPTFTVPSKLMYGNWDICATKNSR